MKNTLLALTLAALAAPAAAGEVADATVARLLGTSGVTHTTKTQSRHGMTYSDVTYQDGAGILVVYRLGSADQFALWQQVAGDQTQPVAGLGAAAFRMNGIRTVCAKGAAGAACATPYPARKGPVVSDEQLVALVKAAL